jgi:small subunit ribosomal protein S20
MPNTASAKKRLRQNEARRQRNRAVKSAVRTQIKKVHQALQAGDLPQAEQNYRLAAKQLDQAGAANIIHTNAVARRKSRLQRMIKQGKLQSAGGN